MQVVEVQACSGLPHTHKIAWCTLTPALRILLTTLQGGDSSQLTMADLRPLVELGDRALAVSTSPTRLAEQFPLLSLVQAEEVARLARQLQTHHCTPSCTTIFPIGQHCREFFPRLPSLLSLVARRPALGTREEEEHLEAVEAVHRRVQALLRARERGGEEEQPVEALLQLLRQLGPGPQVLLGGGYWWQGVTFSPGPELDTLLVELGALAATQADTLLLAAYHCSLLIRRLPRFIPRRRVCEAWTASLNPWVLMATLTNHEVDLITSTPATLVGYMTKGSGQRSLVAAVKELRRRGRRGDMAAARRLESAVRAGHREVTATEACYRLDSRLPFSSTSWGKVARVNAHLGQGGQVTVTMDKVRYSQRPPSLDHLCLGQFVMLFRLAKPGQDAMLQQAGALIPVAVPMDTDLPPGHLTHLPAVLPLQDGLVMRQLRAPRVVDGAPATTYGSIMMLKVNI